MSEAVTQIIPETPPDSRYAFEEIVAAGGEGKVYAGIDRKTGYKVALKVVNSLPLEKSQEAAIKKIHTEARVSAKAEHGNIIPVKDFFRFQTADGAEKAALVMNYKNPKDNLKEIIRSGKNLPLEAIHAFVYQIADALEFLYKQDNVHGDIGPSNFFLEEIAPNQWHATLIDFGVSRRVRELLKEQGVPGKPNFLAPEAFKGNMPDSRSEVYALGLVLYYTLTLERLRNAPTQGEAAKAAQQDGLNDENKESLISSLKNKYPHLSDVENNRLIDALNRALRLKPEDRFSSPMELAKAMFPEPPERSSRAFRHDPSSKL